MTETKSRFNLDQELAPSGWINRYTGEEIPALSSKQQKHEEIKRKAWELFVKFLTSGNEIKVNKKRLSQTGDFIKFSWFRAEEFYNFAKEKEKKL